MSYYGRWITPPLAVDDYLDEQYAESMISQATCFANDSDEIPPDYDHPFGADEASTTTGLAAAQSAISKSPSPPTASSWANGRISSYSFDLSGWSAPSFVPALPEGAVSYQLDDSIVAVDHWKMRAVHWVSDPPGALRRTGILPFSSETVEELIADPDPDGVMAGIKWWLYRVDPFGTLTNETTDDADATVAANGGHTYGWISKRGFYDDYKSAAAAGTKIAEFAVDAEVGLEEFLTLPDVAGRHYAFVVGAETVFNRDPRTPIQLPDWAATAICTSTPVYVMRYHTNAAWAFPRMSIAAVYQPPKYRFLYSDPPQDFDNFASARPEVSLVPAVPYIGGL